MTAYADTGFLVTLYKEESTSARAAAAIARVKPPVLLSHLSELEFHNALHLAVFRKQLTKADAGLKKTLILEDLERGIFAILPIPASELYPKARELADRHSPRLGTRSLDLMHVAAALLLKADIFFSFDGRQRKAAKAEGMSCRPR